MNAKFKIGEVRSWQVPHSALHGKGKILAVWHGPWDWEYKFDDGWVAEQFVIE